MIDISIDTILPTQLYISQLKYDHWSEQFDANGPSAYDPVPIKQIGDDLFYTDGHTRALLLWQRGVRSIRAEYDGDDLDWVAYVQDLKWCRDEGIASISDLGGRVVSHDEYKEKWIARCDEAHEVLEKDHLGGLEIGFEDDEKRRHSICREVLESLPQWFGIEEAVRDYTEAVRHSPFVAADLYGKPIGFCAIKVNHDMNADLYVLGIFPEFHRLGIGKQMIEFVTNHCRGRGIPYITVKTLSSIHPDEGYRKTRLFYEACGFRPFEEFPTLWDEANPCLYMLKRV